MTESLHIVCPRCEAVNRLPAPRLREAPACGKCKHPLFEARPLEVGSDSFMRHISRNEIPVLADFWAPWCGPCRMMAPAFEQAARELEPQMRLVKLNTEDAQDLAARYAIRSIPTLALFAGGREVARQPGAMDARGIVAWARAHAR